jgi:protein-disulfide reductase (glutathione)
MLHRLPVVIGALLLAVVALTVTAEGDAKENDEGLARGFGSDIDWVEWTKAVSIARDLNKPIFLLIHKTWCGACKTLKRSFETSPKREELVELSKEFVMVNTEDDEEPEHEEYSPDGRYIPRIFFLRKDGSRLDLDNKKNFPRNAYYYPQLPDVVKAMKEALELYKSPEKKEEDTTEEAVAGNEAKKDKTTEKTKTDKAEDKKAKDGEAKKTDKKEKDSKKEKEEKTEKKDDKKEKTEKKKTDKKEETKKTLEKKEETPKSKTEKDGKKKSEKKSEKKDKEEGAGECPHAKKAKEAASKKKKDEKTKEKSKKETKQEL